MSDSRILLKASHIFNRPMNEIQVIGVLQEVRDNEIKNAKYARVVQILNQICKGVCYVGYKPQPTAYNYTTQLAEYERKVALQANQRMEHHPKFDGEDSSFTIESWDLQPTGIWVCLEWCDRDGATDHKYLDMPNSWFDLDNPDFMDIVKRDVIELRIADDERKATAERIAKEAEILKKTAEIEKLQAELDKKRAELVS